MMNKHDDDLRKLRDDFVRFKREVTDALENLDESNFSGNMKKIVARLGGASAGFEAYADAKQAVARMFAEYKTEISSSITEIKAQATADRATIETIAKWQTDNDENVRSIASIKQQADNNRSDIVILSSRIANTQSSLASVQTRADASGAFINLLAYSGNKNIDTSKGYYYDKDNDEYVFYDFEGEPVSISSYEFAGIYIEAMNNGATSGLTSVRLNADVIKFGDYASVDNYGNFYAKRLWGDSSGTATIDSITYPGFFYAEIGSGGFNSANQLVGANLYVKDYEGNIMYGFQHKFTEGEDADSVNFIAGGASVWGYNYGQYKLYPKGTWNFSSCSVEGLGLVPVFG